MNKLLTLIGTLLLACGAFAAEGEPALQVEGYARETLPGTATSAAYLTLRNSGGGDLQLRSVELPGLENASAALHTTVNENGISRMRPLESLEIPAGGEVRMAPGGAHLMLHHVKLRAGERLSLRLYLAGGEVVEVSLPVRRPQPESETHHHHG